MGRLPDFFRDPAERAGTAVAAALCAATGFVPQFGGPGYESALAGGVLLPSVAAVTTALVVSRARPEPFDAFGRGVVVGVWLSLVGIVVTTLHGLRAGFCDAPLGYELWFTGPLPGTVLGGACGSLAGLIAERARRRRLVAIALGLAGPVAGVAVSLIRFYTSPMVYGFDPFAGYFAGPLYDTVVDPGGRLLTYRAGTLATLLAATVTALHFRRSEGERLRFRGVRRWGVALAGVAALAVSLTVTAFGDRLGHYSTAASIEASLGRSLVDGRCRVVHAASISLPDAARVGRECRAHLVEIERYLGARAPDRVTVFLFASEQEKGLLMGAQHTYIAKPWRAEVYVQAAGFPHPVLGHELAHVVSGAFAEGPFRVAGPWFGLVPDPGRIEGLAVAASPGEDDDFTLFEWSKALVELGLMPDLRSVFRLGFLAKSSSTAYTVAGAFVSFFHDRYGATALRRWYGGESLSSVTGGKDLPELEREFRARIAREPLLPELLALAKTRFDRPSIFGRACPRTVDRELAIADAQLGAGDARGARETLDRLLKLDPDNTRAKFGLASCSLRAGDVAAAVRRLEALAGDPALTRLEQARATEARADVLLAVGDVAAALDAYQQVELVDADEDRRRTIDVKRAARDPELRTPLVTLLIGTPRAGASWDAAAPELGALAARPGGGLASYLLGRNLWMRGRLEEARGYLDRALALGLELPRVRREALRLRVWVGAADPASPREPTQAALGALLADPELRPALRDAMTRFAARSGLRLPPGSADAAAQSAH